MYTFFNRIAIKERAKQYLKGHYWLALGVALLTTAGVSVGFNWNINFNDTGISESFRNFGSQTVPSWSAPYQFDYGSYRGLAMGVMLIVAVVALVMLAFQVAQYFFVGGPLEIGGCKYYLGLTRGQSKFKSIVYAFSNDAPNGYINACKTMFFRQLYIFLWSLLAIIPIAIFIPVAVIFFGRSPEILLLFTLVIILATFVAMIPAIIKSIEYSMIPYLLAEHPEMSRQQAFAASKDLTDGHKGHLFVLELSFLGWILLGLLCCGIGVIFVTPYMAAAEAEAYCCLCSLKCPPAPPAYGFASAGTAPTAPAPDFAAEQPTVTPPPAESMPESETKEPSSEDTEDTNGL